MLVRSAASLLIFISGAAAYAIEGCLPLLSVTGTVLSGGLAAVAQTGLFSSLSACSDQCQTAKFNFAFILGLAGVTCYCSNNPPLLSTLQSSATKGNADTGSGICGTLSYNALQVNTKFVLAACSPANAITSTTTVAKGTVTSVSQCVAQCIDYPISITNFATSGANAGACSCATGSKIASGDQSVCSNTRSGVYFNTVFPSVSGLTKRKAREEKERKKRMTPLCPKSMSACMVGGQGEDFSVDNFECIDTTSELESCGGCMFGTAQRSGVIEYQNNGTDCSSIPGVRMGGVTCSQGECEVYACAKGFLLVNNACVKRQR